MACVSRCSARWMKSVINQVATVAIACQSKALQTKDQPSTDAAKQNYKSGRMGHEHTQSSKRGSEIVDHLGSPNGAFGGSKQLSLRVVPVRSKGTSTRREIRLDLHQIAIPRVATAPTFQGFVWPLAQEDRMASTTEWKWRASYAGRSHLLVFRGSGLGDAGYWRRIDAYYSAVEGRGRPT